MADENKSMRELINENRRLRESVENQTEATKDTSSKLNEVGGVIKEDLKGVTDIVTSPLKSFASAIPGLSSIGKIVGILSQPKDGMSAAEVEKSREEQRAAEEQTTLLESMVNGIVDLKDSFLQGLQKSAGFGLGAIAGLIAAPVITLVNFFKTLSVEFKFLKTLTKNIAGGKLFAPLRGLFSVMRTVFNASLSLQNSALKLLTKLPLVGGVFATIGNVFMSIPKIIGSIVQGAKIGKFFAFIGNTVMRAVNFVKGIFTPVINFFKTLTTFTGAASGAFSGIAKFAAGFGRILGKIFLPITILMSAFDFITGFMDGYEEEGILGGLEGGLSKLFANLIGMPLDLLKSAVSWIAGVFGFDGVSETLDSFSFSELITNMIGGIFDGVSGVFAFLGDLFDFSDLTLFEGFLKLVDLVFLPLNLAINFVKGLFGWGEEDEGESFSLATFITDKISEIIDYLMSFLDFDVGAAIRSIPGAGKVLDFLGIGGGDEEESVATPSQTIRENDSRIAELEDQIARSNAGENVFFGRDSVGRDEAQAEIDRLRELNRMAEGVARSNARQSEIDGIARPTANMVAMADAERSSLDAAVRQVQNSPPIIVNNSPTTVNGGGGGNSFIPVAITNRGVAWQGNDF